MNVFEVICSLLNSVFNVLAALLLFSLFAEERRARVRCAVLTTLSVLLLTATDAFVQSSVLTVILSLCITLGISFSHRLKWFNRVLLVCFSYSLANLADIMTIMLINSIFGINLQQINLIYSKNSHDIGLLF